MKTKSISIKLFAFSLLSTLSLGAAVPLRWNVETSRLQPVVFDVVRGETLALEASFQSYGTPVATSNMTSFLCWQTNGMASAWWVTNAVTSATSTSVLFTPEMDPGASVVNGFIGLSASTNSSLITHNSSLSYRAAFTLRFRHGPGSTPNVIDRPIPILDLAHTVVVNPPWPTTNDFTSATNSMQTVLKSYIDEQITGAGLVTPTMTTNISGRVVSNVVTKAYVESLGIESGLDTNVVCNIITNNVAPWAMAGQIKPKTDLTPSTNYTDTCCSTLAASATNYTDAATNDATFVRYKNGALKHGTTEVTANEVGALATNPREANSISWDGTGQILSIESDKLSLTKPGTYIEFTGTGLIIGESYDSYWNMIPGVWREPDKSDFSEFIPDGTPIATIGNITTATSALATKSSVESVSNTVAYLTATQATHTATLATKADSSTVNQLSAQVATQGAHLNAEDAKFVSTNYDSTVNMPEAYVTIKLQQSGTNVWRRIWEEMRRWNAFCGAGFDWQTWGGFHAWSTNLMSIVNETSPKEYAFYDGVTGEVAPDGFFWISQPRIGICAGAGYQRYLDAGSAVWILESNGMCANVGGTTNGYFRISDEEGNVQFEIVKGDKETVPAISRSITSTNVMGVTHWYSVYAVTNAISPPVAKFCRDLKTHTWVSDTEASCPCNVVWTPGVNTYTLEFWPKASEPKMFCKADYDKGGETKIRQMIPTEMQYIILNGTKYGLVPKTVNGELVMGLTTGN